MKTLYSFFLPFASIAIWATGASGALTTVNLGTASNFAVLSKAGLTTTTGSSIVGDVGVSPIASTAITGFGLTMDSSGTFSTSPLVTGKIYASNYGSPTPSMLTTAISDMETAYNDAAGRTLPDYIELGSGDISGMTLLPGLYKWSTDVLITNNLTLAGDNDPNSVFIFQISQDFLLSAAASIFLTEGAQAQNVFWQVGGGSTFETSSHFEGIMLSFSNIEVKTGATMNASLFAQTAVTLDSNQIVIPVPEPATYAAICGAVMAGLVLLRRRHLRL